MWELQYELSYYIVDLSTRTCPCFFPLLYSFNQAAPCSGDAASVVFSVRRNGLETVSKYLSRDIYDLSASKPLEGCPVLEMLVGDIAQIAKRRLDLANGLHVLISRECDFKMSIHSRSRLQ